ncbi:DeoR/GlpR family DNA-binding transcription regulator [soil metagenome]
MEKLSKRQRHDRILARLGSSVSVRISELAEEFAVTTETIRRDLDELAELELLSRTYGGAALRTLSAEPGIATRAKALVAERRLIAQRAVRLVKPGDVLAIDAGSTTTHFAEALVHSMLDIKVITNSFGVARTLSQSESASVLFCPGEVRLTEEGVFGPETIEFIGRYHADIAFIGAGGFDTTEVTDADDAGTAVKRAIMARSARTVLLADHTKAGSTQFSRVCVLEDLDVLVTDAPLPEDLRREFSDAKVEVEVAELARAGMAA